MYLEYNCSKFSFHADSKISFSISKMMKSALVFLSIQISSLGITPFFVENVSELQLCAIKLVTAVSTSAVQISLCYAFLC